MKFRTYVWVDGESFDADSFNASSEDASLQGLVLSRKKLTNGKVESGGRYWKSEVIDVFSEYPEEALSKLLSRLKDELLRIRDLPGIRIVAELVAEYEDTDSMRGFFFTKENIRLLAELGANLDIDVVRKLK